MNAPTPHFFAAARGLWTLTWRSRVTWKRLPLFLTLNLSLPVFAASVFRSGESEPFQRLLMQLYFFSILPIFCISEFGAMIRDELQEDTMTFLITRPLTRARIFLLKYLTVGLWVQLIALGNGLAFWAAGIWLEVPDLASLILRLVFVQALAVLAYGALASLLGLITQKYLIAGIVYCMIVEFGFGQIPTNINVLSISHHLQSLLAHHPGLQGLYQWEAAPLPSALGMVLLGTGFFLGLATLMFHLREYHHAEEMQKGGS